MASAEITSPAEPASSLATWDFPEAIPPRTPKVRVLGGVLAGEELIWAGEKRKGVGSEFYQGILAAKRVAQDSDWVGNHSSGPR